MPHAIRIHETGGPEVPPRWEEVTVGDPGDGEGSAPPDRGRPELHRHLPPATGLYPVQLPTGIGLEGAGVVEAVGPGVDSLAEGDRVAYAGGPLGAYADIRLMPAHRLVKVPEGDRRDRQAAAMMLQGNDRPSTCCARPIASKPATPS